MNRIYYISMLLKRFYAFTIAAMAFILLSTTAFGQGSCPPVWLPLEENFNTTDSLPMCWERWENFDEPAMKAHIVSTPVAEGSGALMISCGSTQSTVHRTVLRARKLSQPANGIRMTLKLRANQMGTGERAVIAVGVCSGTSDNYMTNFEFDTVQVIEITTSNVWTSYEVDFGNYSGNGNRLAFLMSQPMQTGTAHKIFIDEMIVERCSVSDLWVSHRASDELTLHWTSIGQGTANLTVTPQGGGNALTFDNVSSPYRITGLTPSTTYTLTLTPQCAGEQLPGVSQSIGGTTLAGPRPGLMYCEDFESIGMPAGWTAAGGATTATTPHYGGSRALQLASGGAYAVLPIITLANGSTVAIGDLMFSAMLHATSTASQLEVCVTNYPEEASELTPIDTVTPTAANSWGQVTKRLDRYTGTARYMALRTIGGGTITIDDFDLGRCIVTGVALAGYTSTTATIEWDVPEWIGNVLITPSGSNPITVTSADGTTANGKRRYTITGLEPGGYYSYVVSGACDDACDAGTVNFNTLTQEYNLPYCTEFEMTGTLPTDWTVDVAYSNTPRLDNTQHHSGSRSLRMSAAGNVSSGNYSMASLPPIATSGTVVVSFAAYGSAAGTLEIGTIDGIGGASSFIAVGTISVPSGEWHRYAVSIASIAAGHHVALRYSHNGSGERSVWVDDLAVARCGVSDVSAYDERANGATLAWASGCDSVDIQYRKRGTANTQTVNVATSPLVLNDLDQGSTYDYYLRCTEGGEQSCWIYGGWFVTNAGALTADYCHNGTVSLNSSAALWNLPYLEENDYTGLRVSFVVSGNGTMQVGLTTAEGSAATFTALGSTITATSTPTRYSVLLTGHEAQGRYIALRRLSGSQTVQKLRLSRGSIVSFAVGEVTATTATLTWSTEGSVDSVTVVCIGGSNDQQVTVAGQPGSITLTGLTAGTSYSFSLTAKNNLSVQSCTEDEGIFVTLGADITDGWCEDFGSTSAGSLPTGWTAVTGQPTVSYYNSSNRLLLSSTSSSSAMVALPSATADFSQTPLKLRVEAFSASGTPEQSSLVAGIMSDRNNAATFTPLATIHPTSSAQTYLLDLGSYSGSGRIVALQFVSPGASRSIYIDNLALATEMVAGVTVNELTNHSVRINWQGATSVQIHWSGGDTTATGNSCTIDGLAAGTNYTFTIVAAGQWQTLNCHQLMVAARTLDEPTTAPMCNSLETYDNNTSLPYGWTRLSTNNYPISYNDNAHSGSRSLRFYTTSGGSDMAVSPMFENTVFSGLYVSFYVYTTSSASTLEVGTMSDPTDASTFVARGSVTVQSGGWRRYEVSLAGAPASHRYLAFRHTATSSANVYLDDLMLNSCPMPMVEIHNPRSTSMEVRWSGASGDVTIEWYRTGYSSGHQQITTSGGSYTITGLTPATDYTVEVWPVCDDTSAFMCHKISVTQQTLPLPSAIPYCQSFTSSGFPSDWHTHNIGGSVSSSTSGYSGRSLQLNLGSGASSFTSVSLPQINVSDVCADIDSLWLEFHIIRSGSALLQLGTMQDLNDSSDFTPFKTINLDGITANTWTLQTIKIPVSALTTGILTLRLVHNGSTTSAWIRIDELCLRHCMAKNVTLISSTPTSATFTWESYGAEGLIVSWNGGTYYATTSPFTITGLDPNASYTFSFDAQCPCNVTSHNPELVNILRRMPAEPMAILPVCYDFGKYSDNSFPNEWRRSSSSYPKVSSTYAYSPTRSLDFYATSSSPITMAMQPIPVGCTHVVVSFRVYCTATDAASGGRLQVGLVSSADTLSNFTAIGSVTIDALDTWQDCFFDINNPSSRYIAFRFAPGSGSYHMYLDDLGVTECGVTSLTVSSTDLTVTTLGTPSAYQLTVFNTEQESSRTITLPASPTTIPFSSIPLATDSTYTLSVAAVCDGSITCTPVTANALARHEVPYCEEFNGTGLHPDGWTVAVRNSATYPRKRTVGSDSSFYHMQATTGGCVVALPLLPYGRTLGGLHVWLQVKYDNTTDMGNATVELGSLADNGTFTTLATLQNSTLVQSHNITLPASNGTRLAIRARSTSGTRNVYLDHLQITDYPRPDALLYTRTSCHLQHIYWNNTAGNSHYRVEWGPANFTPGNGTMVMSDSCHVLLSPTQPSTTYRVVLYDTAGTQFCTPYSFTTLPASTTLPYCISSTRTLSAGTMLYLPEIDVPVASTTMVLTWRTAQAGRMIVGVMTEYQTPSTFTPVDTLYPAGNNVWQRSAIDFYSYADTGRFVALRFEGATGYIQQLTLQTVPQPVFHVLNSHEIEANLPDGYPADYWLRVVMHGQSQSSATAVHVDSTHYVITGLTPYTEYDIYVLDNSTYTTCAPAVTLRTHLDIDAPYCTDLTSQPTGWNFDGRYRVMPYVLIDSLDTLHLYFTSRGTVTVGLQSALDDTTSFLPLTTLTSAAYTEQTLHLNLFTLTATHHYISFRYESSDASIAALTVLRVPRPSFHVLSSSSVEVTVPDGQPIDYWLEFCPQGVAQGNGTMHHIVTSPDTITGLSMYTYYNIYLLHAANTPTCDAPTFLRTHLDITAPYCESYSSSSDGWYILGNTLTMPRLIIDTMGDVYVTFVSRGTVHLGVQPTLDDTTAFVPLTTVQSSVWEEHVVHLFDYASLVGSRHYISFHGGELQTVYLHTCPLPIATLTAFDQVTFQQQETGIDYWIRCTAPGIADTLVHPQQDANGSYTLTGLLPNTYYSFHFQCDSATQGCIPPVNILTGVRITAPHCVQLGGISLASVNTGTSTSDGSGTLPAGWRALQGPAGTRLFVMPILDIDSVSRIFARFSYRIAQTGSALAIGVMTDDTDPYTFTPISTLTDASGSFVSHTVSFSGYSGSGLYIAFQASGNAPAQVYLDSVALQTVPFIECLLTEATTAVVRTWDGNNYLKPSYIAYSQGSLQTIVRADTLPWTITGLNTDATYQFSLRADSLIASCYPAYALATTHTAPTPHCDITATLSASSPLWRGPELTEPNLANLRLRFTASCNRSSLQVVVGTLTWRNIDSTFLPIDTITLTSTTARVYQSPFNAPATAGRFLAFRLLPVANGDNVTITNLSMEHCFTPLTAHLTLIRHNIVSLDCSQGETIEWVEYGPSGFTPGSGTTVHVTSLPMEFTLANSTTYDFYTLCDSASTTCAAPITITTLPSPPPLGWCETFDSHPVGSLPSNWRSPTAMTTAQEAKVNNSRSHSPSNSLYMNATIGHSVVTILPDLGLDSLNALSVSLWLNSSNPTTSHLEVGVIFNTSDPESFYPLHTLTVNTANTWQRHIVDLRDAPDGAWFVALRCEGTVGLNRLWVDDLHIAECGANSLTVAQVEAQQVTLRWRQTGTPTIGITVIPSTGTSWTVTDAGATTFGSWRELTVTGLEALTNYRFAFNAVCDQTTSYCTTNYTDTVRVFTPAGGTGCIDPTNLAAAYTSCFYGNYNNPYANTGVIDYGYSSVQSRHTVHYNLDERDPRTGGQLATVPEGAMASVRLGNWTSNSTSPEAESLVYGLSVDTMDFDLLIMRYAAVLQDPDHAASDQPRFSLELLNSNMEVIDSVCARADFIANWQMGWNFAANSVLWKDWTTVGLDMTPYSGQTVYIRLTTRDCNEGSHYGYAYFTLECMRKSIHTSECGVVTSNQLTAPSGFNYRWYTSSSDSTISTLQTITVPSNNYITYLCDNAFIDNPTCYFTMSAFAGVRLPLSLASYSASLAPCSWDVTFVNHSTISSDGVTPVGTGEGVETARWLFGDGDSATTYNATHHYSAEGLYDVQLITGIADDRCLDTLTIPLNLLFPPTGLEITGPSERCHNATPDTLWLRGVVTLLSSSTGFSLADSTLVGTHKLYTYRLIMDSAGYGVGTHTFSATALDSVGCTVSLSHNVVVYPVYHSLDTRHICTLLLPYSWRDTAFNVGTPTGRYTIHRYTVHSCDSIMKVDLNVYDNAIYTKRDTALAAICDNQSYYFSDSLLTPDPTATHNLVANNILYTDSLFSSIGCDSLSTVVLTVHPTYDHHLYDTLCTNQSYTWGFPPHTIFQPWTNESQHHASDTLLPATVPPTDTSFTDNLQSAQQCDSISSLHLHLHPAYHLHYSDSLCDAHWVVDSGLWPSITGHWQAHAYHFEDTAYTLTGEYLHQLTTGNLCDSARTLHLKVYPTYFQHHYDTIYDGDTYTFEQSAYTATGIYSHLLPAVYSCDSLRTLHLQCNRRTYIDSVICQNTLPMTWTHHLGSTPLATTFHEGDGGRGDGWQIMKDSVHLSGVAGVDSLVVMTLIVRDTAATYDIVHSCDSLIWSHTPDTTYLTSTSQPYRYLSQLAPFDTTGITPLLPDSHLAPFTLHLAPYSIYCDSVRHLTLTVDYTHFHTDLILACDSTSWRHGEWFYRDTLTSVGPVGSRQVTGPVDTLVTLGGCDSVVSLHLAIRNATYQESIDTFCWHSPYTWRGQIVADDAGILAQGASSHLHYYLTDTLQTHIFHHPADHSLALTCDSVLAISLTQMAKPLLQLSDTILCPQGRYRLLLSTNVPYSRFSSSDLVHHNTLGPDFPTHTSYSLDVTPSEPYSTYEAYVDYHRQTLCPLTAQVSLRPVVVPEADFRYSPGALRYNDLEFDAWDLTPVHPRSIHPNEPDVWRRRWIAQQTPLSDTSYHLTHEIILAELPPDDRDTLQLQLSVFNGQCYDTAVHLLPMLRVAIFAPNAFTPTQETNNRFIIATQGVYDAELSIYNREGLLVYRSNDLSVGWDGRRNDGTLCEQGNYVWKLIYRGIDRDEGKRDEVGTVLLIR